MPHPLAPDLVNQEDGDSLSHSHWLRDETVAQSSANQNLPRIFAGAIGKDVMNKNLAGTSEKAVYSSGPGSIYRVYEAWSCQGPSFQQKEKTCLKMKPTQSPDDIG